MATLGIAICNVVNQVPESRELAAERIPTSASSQQSTIQAASTHKPNQFWVLAVTGGNVWVKFGSNPTAAAGSGFLITDGQVREFKTQPSDKVAVINA
jgi:hypothetical protein